MGLSDVVKQYRAKHGLSLRAFAARCGISHTYLDQIEKNLDPRTGKSITPTIDTLKGLSAGMGMTLEELMNLAGYLSPSRTTKEADTSITPAPLADGDNPILPIWLSKLPPDMQAFLEEESKRGWPFLRLARGVQMQDLGEEEVRAIVETWMDAKKRHAEGKKGQ